MVRTVQYESLSDVADERRLTIFWEFSVVMLVLYAHDASEEL